MSARIFFENPFFGIRLPASKEGWLWRKTGWICSSTSHRGCTSVQSGSRMKPTICATAGAMSTRVPSSSSKPLDMVCIFGFHFSKINSIIINFIPLPRRFRCCLITERAAPRVDSMPWSKYSCLHIYCSIALSLLLQLRKIDIFWKGQGRHVRAERDILKFALLSTSLVEQNRSLGSIIVSKIMIICIWLVIIMAWQIGGNDWFHFDFIVSFLDRSWNIWAVGIFWTFW